MADVVETDDEHGGEHGEHDHSLAPGDDTLPPGADGDDQDHDVHVHDVTADMDVTDVGDMSTQQDDHTHQSLQVPGSASKSERHSLTLDQRRALRRWAHSQATRPSHKACIEWFFNQYGQTISQSTISHSLSPKYARLDSENQFSGSRLRFGNWPDVEKLVLLWHGQVVASGRQPSNEELAEKAKNIFTQLPRYKDETPPEFSPGWIHRFKKRYGLLIRRQRRHGTAPNPADDIPYLVDAIPRFMTVEADTSPTAIRDQVLRIVGVEASLGTCARVRDEIIHRLEQQQQQQQQQQQRQEQQQQQQTQHQIVTTHHGLIITPQQPLPTAPGLNDGETMSYMEPDDPELVLQNALRALQQEEADAEAEAAAIREERSRQDQEQHHQQGGDNNTTPGPQSAANGGFSTPIPPTSSQHTRTPSHSQHRFTPTSHNPNHDPSLSSSSTQHSTTAANAATAAAAAAAAAEQLQLTPISNHAPVSQTDRPLRCPFCVNQRMLRTIKEAVEHMSTHVVV